MADPELTPDLQAELDEALFSLDELINESPEEALSMFQTLPEAVRNRPEFLLTRARALQAKGQLKEAQTICESLLTANENTDLSADVHHLLGDILEDQGQSEAANIHFKKTLHLDRELFASRSHLSEGELSAKLEPLLKQVISAHPPAVAQRITTTRIELLPSEQDVTEGLDPRAFTAFDDQDGQGVLRVFCANIDAEYGDLDELGEFDEHVLVALEYQLSDHFGQN